MYESLLGRVAFDGRCTSRAAAATFAVFTDIVLYNRRSFRQLLVNYLSASRAINAN